MPWNRIQLIAVAVALAGCGNADLIDLDADRDIPTDLGTPAEVVASHVRAWEAKDLEAYLALLAPDFCFHPRSRDVQNFPWLPDAFWALDVETAIVSNMMNPEFDRGEGPIDTIDFGYTILDEREVSEGEVMVVLDADVTVLTDPYNGWAANTRFDFVMTRDTRGFYRIREIREGRVVVRSEEASFGQIKALYR